MAFSYLQCSSSDDLVVYQENHDQDQLNLPTGYRFSPQNHELVLNYLANKIMGQKLPANIITTIDLYQYDPHQLPISGETCGVQNSLQRIKGGQQTFFKTKKKQENPQEFRGN
ncbi:hypothetical protein EZV62_024987 [Acer yangbiense]|uniref:NAC domain-containing protein n=1 Tax=Acer yangbiense TaxID=1000413 RepID=A0A5C7GXS8_9ROSI|nr:hypothetical protein EZV62_024987 [Acer yangbiense]